MVLLYNKGNNMILSLQILILLVTSILYDGLVHVEA